MKSLQPAHSQSLGGAWILNIALAGGGFRDSSLNSFAGVFIRKVELAAYEYAVAYEHWRSHGITDPGTGRVHFTLPAAGDHLELCVLTLRRALRCLDKLRVAKSFPAMDRLTRTRIEHLAAELAGVRNSIEHIDAEIAGGLDEGEPNTLLLSQDGKFASIASQKISTDSVHTCISLLLQVAETLSTHR